MKLIIWARLFGLLAVGVAAVVVLNQKLPEGPALSPSSASSDISTALSDEKSNSDIASSAPQQQVVEGWAARDLLAIVGRETGGLRDDLQAAALSEKPDLRVPRLLTLGVRAIAWWGVTAAGGELIATRRRRSETIEPDAQPTPFGGPLPATPPPFDSRPDA
jgi:hypothetical protein